MVYGEVPGVEHNLEKGVERECHCSTQVASSYDPLLEIVDNDLRAVDWAILKELIGENILAVSLILKVRNATIVLHSTFSLQFNVIRLEWTM